MERDKEQVPALVSELADSNEDDEFSMDDIKFEAPERPQIQLSKRSEALRCGYVAT